jgi:hypothetical protein
LSTKGVNVALAGVFGGGGAPLVFVFVFVLGIIGGGGITASSGPGSLNTANPPLTPLPVPGLLADELEPVAEATRLVFPGCRKVVPTILFTSGTFSFTLVFLVPRSCHASDDEGASGCEEDPEGSTNIWSLDELDEVMGVETLRGVCLEAVIEEEDAEGL